MTKNKYIQKNYIYETQIINREPKYKRPEKKNKKNKKKKKKKKAVLTAIQP